ncbi:signal peptidase II [Candidatus Woesearchaeota archaeon]|nr:signal peptidase II [Candidatus Woesearchaeota archaeon]MBT4387783.1 signal peptidase II [Candidatus Woesearchaeota archaeon]MBT4595602.1 signal peptidase II [Candidatus Woesearchaeota archaeon]MBT5740915.1 signal peptidase II [Candidatus Woesearchaeota archaeon]MBT6505868.1 signal peptidase II [Candidatus Woesearchaeota archaeon]
MNLDILKSNIKKIFQIKFFIYFIFLVLIDRVIKIFTENKILNLINTNIFEFNIFYVKNTGISFGLFGGYINLFIIITIIFFLIQILFYDYIKEYGFWLLILNAGAMGNLLDRIFFGYVMDMFSLKVFFYTFNIFNFADILITISVIVILYKEIIKKN